MDLLSNLASKALQDPDTVPTSGDLRPRLVSQFEPTGGPILPVPAETAEDGLEAAFHESDRMQTVLPRNGPAIRTSDRSVVEDQPPVEKESPLRPTPTGARPMGAQPLNETETQPIMNRVRSISRAHEDSSPSSMREPTEANGPRATGTQETHMTEIRASIQPHPVVTDPVPHADHDRGQKNEPAVSTQLQSVSGLQQNEAAHQAGVLRAPKVIAERFEVKHVESGSLAPSHLPLLVPAVKQTVSTSQTTLPETEPQMPTIHVTIGRVEVKAVTSNPPSRSRTAVSSTMSLDEYLRRRKGSDR